MTDTTLWDRNFDATQTDVTQANEFLQQQSRNNAYDMNVISSTQLAAQLTAARTSAAVDVSNKGKEIAGKVQL
jgi:hypothetical protein